MKSPMYSRFTHKSRTGRGKIPANIREDVYTRDDFTCVYCRTKLPKVALTIDHLVPLSGGGLDEMSNYVTCCSPCNARKRALPLSRFAHTIKISIEDLPVHGDPVIDNTALPIEIRLLRKAIFDKIRKGTFRARGPTAQKKIEKAFRRNFWQTPQGQRLKASFPTLPGPARIMIPEIETIAKSESDFILLLEIAKSASTRNLIGTVLRPNQDLVVALRQKSESSEPALHRRIEQAIHRFERQLASRARANTPSAPTPQRINDR